MIQTMFRWLPELSLTSFLLGPSEFSAPTRCLPLMLRQRTMINERQTSIIRTRCDVFLMFDQRYRQRKYKIISWYAPTEANTLILDETNDRLYTGLRKFVHGIFFPHYNIFEYIIQLIIRRENLKLIPTTRAYLKIWQNEKYIIIEKKLPVESCPQSTYFAYT